jgi:hypothetical protein
MKQHCDWSTTAKRSTAIVGCVLTLVATSDVAQVMVACPQHRVTTLTGAAAKAHMERRLLKHPEMRAAHEKAILDMRQRGFKPTDKYFVRIEDTKARPLQRLTQWLVPSLAAQTMSNSDGEVDLSAWDTGDDGYFAAEAFFANYNDGGTADGTMEFDIHSQDTFGVVSANGQTSSGSTSQYANAIQEWAVCTLSGCAGSLTACWLSGPGWGACAIAWCGGAEVGCAVGAALHHVYQREP